MFLPSGQIGNLVLLNSDLRVNYNSFTGPIPTELGRLTDVTVTWRLKENSFCSDVPTEVQAALERGDGKLVHHYWKLDRHGMSDHCDLSPDYSADPGANSRANPGADERADPGANSRANPGADERADPGANGCADPGADERADPGVHGRADPVANNSANPGADERADPVANNSANPGADERADPGAHGRADPGADKCSDPGADHSPDAAAISNICDASPYTTNYGKSTGGDERWQRYTSYTSAECQALEVRGDTLTPDRARRTRVYGYTDDNMTALAPRTPPSAP
eukprot:CAMPEP_0119477370 /NCGR_PEP_ID=MMETSP1344-20130328/7535_1 /TAXON_ID=236787 /ORGANISM="Florenciella parvula, Strain CCMP2471" /LENGTH=284 /DNA_ID=CAMNT_0007511339 /DNA_START=215 /DNA_END=1066 /DNA_ORIENTATION=-